MIKFELKKSFEKVRQITPIGLELIVLQNGEKKTDPYSLSFLNSKTELKLISKNAQYYFVIGEKVIYSDNESFLSYIPRLNLSNKLPDGYYGIISDKLILSRIKKGEYVPYEEFLVDNSSLKKIPLRTNFIFDNNSTVSWVIGNDGMFSGYKKMNFDGKIIWEIDYNNLFSKHYKWGSSKFYYENELFFVELEKEDHGGIQLLLLIKNQEHSNG